MTGRPLSRRGLLAGGAVLLGAGALAAVTGDRRDCGPHEAGPPPGTATVLRGRLESALSKDPIPYVVALPPGLDIGGAVPTCLCLHGGNGSAAWVVDTLRLQDHLAAAGVAPFALVAMDAGALWWRPQAAGDPHAILLDELLPFAAQEHGVGTGPLAATGWSVGGYGALRLAQRRPERFVAVAAVSPAIRRSTEVGSPDAPDDDVIAHAGRLTDMAVHAVCGRSDTFAGATVQLLEVLRALNGNAEGGLSVGCHNIDFRHRAAGEQVRFLSRALAG